MELRYLVVVVVVFFFHGSLAQTQLKGIDCDFESTKCEWEWNSTISNDTNGFTVYSADEMKQLFREKPGEYRGPFVDASNNPKGHYLLVEIVNSTGELHVRSPKFSHTKHSCRLNVSLLMVNMTTGNFKVVIEAKNFTSWVIEEKQGNSRNMWERFVFIIGRIKQEFRIILEVSPSRIVPAHLSLDNIKLQDCFSDTPPYKACSKNLFRCSLESENSCINKTQVCDIRQDCWNGADERQGCEKVPEFARCTFEKGWCGWENLPTSVINWTRHNGSTSTGKRITGPGFDHTYQNQTGMYLYVNMSTIKTTILGASAVLESSVINPPPKYHGRPNSSYYQSCFIRFFYHQFGPHSGSLALILNEQDPVGDRSIRLWFMYGSKDDKWQRQVVLIPTNITNKYTLQFEARRGLRARGDVAIDDVTMSPECFGLNVPINETDGYNYDDFPGHIEPTKIIYQHKDFVNKSVYYFSSCGIRGRTGPTADNCSRAYNNTRTKVQVLLDPGVRGVQRWIVPYSGFYTIIAKGASGGQGSDGKGHSRGSMATGVVELTKDQSLFILVGQEGESACRKNFGGNPISACTTTTTKSSTNSNSINPLKEILTMEIEDGGGGGGGASFVYGWSTQRGRFPLVVGGGGGGIGGTIREDGSQHGKGYDPSRLGATGSETTHSAGAGGGWSESNGTWRERTGGALMQGAIGGKSCGHRDDVHGIGGFGGGGGGCHGGGGGGGYAGGSANGDVNGYGGFSYVVYERDSASRVTPAVNTGAGSVIVIPGVQGCGCEYVCVALDEHREKARCVCPHGSRLNPDLTTCTVVESISSESIVNEKFMLSALCVIFAIILTFAIYTLFQHLQRRRKAKIRKTMMAEPDLQLSRLRVTSESMMTEYNPNYEFGGGTYTVRDLCEVPRENLKLVKALGQGAFGEVYQGLLQQRRGDAIELPVAVKTLPELSTSQAETDFLMEALIMSKFTHPNIVHFIGVCFDKHPRFIVLELLAGGDLKNFLRESRPKPERPSPLNMKDLLMCAVDVAKGCAYLEEHRFIHRDIAARNCLLTTKGPGRTVKIADFGMARDIYRADYYRKGGKAMLPIKWMPPEAFQDGIFTAKTDVWSFGVLLWEVMSLGYMPYTGCGNREVMHLVISGGRLEPPANCPPAVYALMTKCWHPAPEDRPCFNLILERLGYCIQDPEVLNAPLPVFNRLPSAERDCTIMRPEPNTTGCLQVSRVSEYLEPNMRPSSSVEQLKPNWETTSFVLAGSDSTQRLIGHDTPGHTKPPSEPAPIPCGPPLNHNNNNNLYNQNHHGDGLPLNASTFTKQTTSVLNSRTNSVDEVTSIEDMNSESDMPFTLRQLSNDAEISC